MNIPFDQAPFSKLPEDLRPWLNRVCEAAEIDSEHRFWRDRLPKGSSVDDAMIASYCIATLFPERVATENSTPVDVEFKL